MNTDMHDDEFNFDPSQYADQGQPILPDPGVYTLRVTSLGPKKDRATGQPVLIDGKFPVLTLNRVEIVEPEDDSAQYAVFADIGTKPFPRKISKGNSVGASKALDLVRAIDVNLTSDVESYEHAADVLTSALNSGATFQAKLGYKAVDRDAITRATAGVTDPEKIRQAWNSNTYYTKAFKRQDGKGYNATVTTPDNKTLMAKLVIDGFVPSNKQGKVGPF